MTARFVDANVLMYMLSRDPREQEKAERAREILKARDLALSTQVLAGLYVQATPPSHADALTHGQAVRLVESLVRFRVLAITPTLVVAAMAGRERFRLSYWDAAILGAARALGCKLALTDGRDHASVRVENPFAALC